MIYFVCKLFGFGAKSIATGLCVSILNILPPNEKDTYKALIVIYNQKIGSSN